MNADELRDMATDALRYWEPRRLLYNALLTAVVLVDVGLQWPLPRGVINFNAVLGLFVLAVLANVAYCAAYVVDLFLQFTHYREQRRWWRAGVAIIGFTFAGVLAHFFAGGAFPPGI